MTTTPDLMMDDALPSPTSNFSDITFFSKYITSDGINPCPIYILSGLILFTLVNYATRWSIPRTVVETKRRNPVEVRWKWRNVLTSFIHSSITGIWAPLAFYSQPSLGADMIHAYSTSAHALISVSIGYFM